MEATTLAVDLDMCTGCFACQNACKMVNNLSDGEKLLHVEPMYCQPQEYQGKLYIDRFPQPVTLDACRACPDRADGQQPVCVTSCMGNALYVGEKADVLAWSESRRTVIFTS